MRVQRPGVTPLAAFHRGRWVGGWLGHAVELQGTSIGTCLGISAPPPPPPHTRTTPSTKQKVSERSPLAIRASGPRSRGDQQGARHGRPEGAH